VFIIHYWNMQISEEMVMIICWWSGGITSAVSCKKAIEIYGKENCRVIFIDTHNEDDDTYRFMKDCEKWYDLPIETITAIGSEFESIQEVWRKWKSLNVATGAICSTRLKRTVREKWQKTNSYTHQVFGFEFDKKEFNRALSMRLNHEKTKPVFPLLMLGLTKEDCLELVRAAGIEVPRMYKMGFKNNNCFKTGCVQGGIGYWQKMKIDFTDKFDTMAAMEHELTDLAGEPVTMLKDQSGEAKAAAKEWKYANLVFLKKHPKYPQLKCIDDMKAREVLPLNDCNGFCGVDELNPKSKTTDEINYREVEL
jgi:3'-phosphoadenosine 5'-phosphosulfate sulfotransferase (PAPS reductase)/FAD synthetase